MFTNREAEETRPELGLPVIEELRLSFHQSREEISMTILVLAPVLKVLEDRVTLELRVLLKVSVDCDVPPVPDFLGQVSGVEDELGFEESVLPCLC